METGKISKVSMTRFAILLGLGCLIIVGCSSTNSSQPESSPPAPTASSQGTVSIEAMISGGTRFVIYCNDDWKSPQRLALVPGEWHTYQFQVPLALRSLRFDPTEMAGEDVQIKSVKFDYSGRPTRWMPLSDLPKWIQYHSTTSLESGGRSVRIHANGADMFVMSTVDVNIYSLESPK